MNRGFAQKILESLMGRHPSEPKETVVVPKLADMLEELVTLPDAAWGKYAFSRDPLDGKFTDEARHRLILRANECGVQYADQMIERYGHFLPQDLAFKLGLTVEFSPIPAGGGHVVFAQFVEPYTIRVFEDCVIKANVLIEEQTLSSVVGSLDVKQTLLAHEIFHYLEVANKTQIFTKTEKVQLWAPKPFRNQSGIVCLGEIAGMAFAKQYLRMPYSPYILDVFLVYGYNEEAAYYLYQEIMGHTDRVQAAKTE